MTATRETMCNACVHLNICRFKERYLDAQSAIDNVIMGATNPIRLQDLDFIEHPTNLKCKFFQANIGARR